MSELPSIEQLIERKALFVVSHSGGKDSQAMLIKLLEIIPREQLAVVHASLGESEWAGALELAQEQAENAGLPFIVARAGRSLVEMVERRYVTKPGPNSSCWPSARVRFCTSDAKRSPIEREVRRYAKENGYTTVVSCMGMRAAESPARAKRVALTVNKRGTVRNRDWFEWLPIHDMATTDVWRTIAAAGQTPHPAYLTGNTRLSCVFCFMASPRDIANGARHRPELYAKYREIETRTSYTFHQSRRSLEEMVRIGNEQLERIGEFPIPNVESEPPIWTGCASQLPVFVPHS